MFGITIGPGGIHFLTHEDIGVSREDAGLPPRDVVLEWCNRSPSASRSTVQWNPESYERRVGEACDWIEGVGVPVSGAGRHRTYQRILAAYAEQAALTGKREPGTVRVRKRVYDAREVRQAMYEAHVIHRIYRYFQGDEPGGLHRMLKKFVKGPDFYPDEGTSRNDNEARNIGVELTVGAEMRMHGLHVSYGDDSYPEPMARIGGFEIAFQCKRMSSSAPQALRDELDDAAHQLAANRARLGSITHGVVVVDATKLVNPWGGSVFIEEGAASYPTRDALYDIAEKAEAEFGHRNAPPVDGMIFLATFPVVLEGSNEIATWCNLLLLRHGNSAVGEEVTELLDHRHHLLKEARAQGRDSLWATV